VKLLDTDETILVVTGTGIAAEDRDRPLAYWLKAEIDRQGANHPYRRAIVVGDQWYQDNRVFHLNPTIAIGGPGVNLVAQELAGALPVVHMEGERMWVQSGHDNGVPRACLWGVDLAGTARAVEHFVTEGLLRAMLAEQWRPRPEGGGAFA